MPTQPADAWRALKRCRLFAGLDESWLQELAAVSRFERHRRGEQIFAQGIPCPGVFIVLEGLVRVYKTAPSGKEHVLHLAEPFSTFAEVAALGRFPTPAQAQALEDTFCLVIPTEELHHLLRAHHELSLQLLSSMAFWVRNLVDLMEDLVLRDALGRVARHLLSSHRHDDGAIQLKGKRKDLASHLNLTGETLSRTLRRLAEQELIELGEHGALSILNERELQRLAEGS